MSAAARLPVVAGTLLIPALAGIVAVPSVRQALIKYFGSNVTSNMFKLAVALWALTNFKNLPFMWHYRVFKGIIYQIYLNKRPLESPKHLFAPLITSSRNTIYDSDYNFHKSNSTYFADLDVARANAVGAIIRTGLSRLNNGDEEGLPTEAVSVKGSYNIALGGVSCFFQRQIEPFQAFDIYTRVLSWDRKWLYLVSHIVKKGSIKPDSYVLQPWRKGQDSRSGAAGGQNSKEEDMTKHIFATSIARYVCKKGRLTINPEIILERSRLLPERPAGVGFPPRTESVAATPAGAQTPAQNNSLTSPETVASKVSSKLVNTSVETSDEDDEWSWDDMERERLRGLKMASHFDALSGLHDEIRAGDVLGQYSDWF